ncbi:DUF2252 family protein [Variovorax sp. J22G73]|uniref:DUF2252 family protein n=1 Tax=unclassified Variovorax TaxID=663243 RepID=UPI002575A53C|nr:MULTISPECIES: DUF2252 family protein [unclassified Variovorax]MDM0007460.1 DUF2252 family protein [Variovorax sp. J22R203]MDM0100181.1 DUF2252 family protein [Variovorax sp. J22G73]
MKLERLLQGLMHNTKKRLSRFPVPHPETRQPALSAARNLKMARSAHAYVRGNTLRFYEWLDSVAPASLPDGPPIWICGDCHIGNLGPVANSEGELAIEIRDFDQTVIGNPAHDIVRLALSLASAARGSDLPGVITARMIEQVVAGYTDAFAPKRALLTLRPPAAISRSLTQARNRTWRHLAAERLGGETMAIPHGPRFWPVAQIERDDISQLVLSRDVRQLVTGLHHRRDDAKVVMLDTAYWMKGCSSLGRLRYAVLMEVGKAVARGRDFCLLDIKEAIKALAPHESYAHRMPDENGARVVAGAQAMSPFLGTRMRTGQIGRRSVFVRELLPQDMKLEFEQLSSDEATQVAYFLARTVGIAHARQMDSATRRAWRSTLTQNHSKVIDAPPWLWSSVVDLVASHERGYLDHCRRYALEAA